MKCLLSAFVGLNLSSCDSDSQVTYKYRLTVEVETPEGVRTGSSVIEVATSESKGALGSLLTTRVRGEAAAINLPDGSTVYALLRSPSDESAAAKYAVTALLPEHPGKGSDSKAWLNNLRALKATETSADLPQWQLATGAGAQRRSLWPVMVTFGSATDPKTVRVLDSQDLGAGARVRRIAVRMTGDRPDEDIRQKLPWLGEFPEPFLKGTGGFGQLPLSQRLKHGDFVRI